MQWLKRGLVYCPEGDREWNQTHAQVPTIDPFDAERWRIYYSARNAEGISQTSYIEVEAGHPKNILYIHTEPILPLGPMGAFDDSGIMPSWVVNHGGVKYLFYIGWTVRKSVPYHNSVCLAQSLDGGETFTKCGVGPLFGPTLNEPYFTGTSCVLVEDGVWKNWYLSTTKWETFDGKPEPFYHLKYAESEDGLHWNRNGTVAIDFKDETEGGIAKASVLREGDEYRMWYSFRSARDYRSDRSRSYRIGYAKSEDGIAWTRMDEQAGINVSDSGWDSEMIAYPHVVEHDGTYFMFYNGNGFGSTGFGYATAEP